MLRNMVKRVDVNSTYEKAAPHYTYQTASIKKYKF